MTDIHERIEAEMDNIQRLVELMPQDAGLFDLSDLELAGVGALIHNFYNGIENVLKQVILSSGQQLPAHSSWHRDLVNLGVSKGAISQSTADRLARYLAFRHFFSHGYALDLDKKRIMPLVKDIVSVLVAFKEDIDKATKNI